MTQVDREKTKPPMKERLFQGQEVLITGGSSGIGQALVDRFSRLGANVTNIDISQPSDIDENTSFIHASVCDAEGLSKQEIGKVDLLVIAAGVTSETNKPTDEEITLMDAVNVDGVKNTLEIISPNLSENAVVVYIGSDDPPKDYYAETKKKGAQLVKEFAGEHSDLKILVAYLGPVRTSLFEKGKPPEVIQRINDNVGLYEPTEFAEELVNEIVDLSQRNDQLREKVMYKKIG